MEPRLTQILERLLSLEWSGNMLLNDLQAQNADDTDVEVALRELVHGAFGGQITTCEAFIGFMESSANLALKWYLKFRPPVKSAKGHWSSPMTVSMHTLLVLLVPELKKMLESDGECTVAWMATTVMETSHQFSRRCMQAHSSGGGQLRQQLCAMGMLLRSIVSVRLARPHHGDALSRALIRSRARAAKEQELKQGAPSCVAVAWQWTHRCCDQGLDGDMKETDGKCTFTPLDAECPSYATGVCGWQEGEDACDDYDPAEYPPVASPRCLYDSRRKPLPTVQATAAAVAAFAPAAPRSALDAAALEAEDVAFAPLPDETELENMYSRTTAEEDAADPQCDPPDDELLAELAELEGEVEAELDALQSELNDVDDNYDDDDL